MPANHTRFAQVTGTCSPAIKAPLLAGLLLAPLLTGCHAARLHPTTRPAVPTDTNAELVQYIGDLPFVTAEPAYRAVYILANDQVFDGDYSALVDEMKAQGLVGGHWRHEPDSLIDRAAVGFLIARACNIRTGLNWRLTRLGRYAYRELTYRRIAHPAGEYGLISGGEFLGILARAEEYLREGGDLPAAAELGAEPGQ